MRRGCVLELNILHWAWEMVKSQILSKSFFLSNFVIIFNYTHTYIIFCLSSFPPSPLPFLSCKPTFFLLSHFYPNSCSAASNHTHHYMLVTTSRIFAYVDALLYLECPPSSHLLFMPYHLFEALRLKSYFLLTISTTPVPPYFSFEIV